jgi:hypothetical protein
MRQGQMFGVIPIKEDAPMTSDNVTEVRTAEF